MASGEPADERGHVEISSGICSVNGIFLLRCRSCVTRILIPWNHFLWLAHDAEAGESTKDISSVSFAVWSVAQSSFECLTCSFKMAQLRGRTICTQGVISSHRPSHSPNPVRNVSFPCTRPGELSGSSSGKLRRDSTTITQ